MIVATVRTCQDGVRTKTERPDSDLERKMLLLLLSLFTVRMTGRIYIYKLKTYTEDTPGG